MICAGSALWMRLPNRCDLVALCCLLQVLPLHLVPAAAQWLKHSRPELYRM